MKRHAAACMAAAILAGGVTAALSAYAGGNGNCGGSLPGLVGSETCGSLQTNSADLTYPNDAFGYSVGTDGSLKFRAGLGSSGAELMRLTGTGSLGLGTTTPKSSLDLSANTDGLILQTASATAGASCTSSLKGAVRYNQAAAVNNVEFCDGTNWRFFAASTTACGTPSGLSFTNLTSQSLSISVSSSTATITFTGCTAGGAQVAVSGAATAQISINGGAWGTSGSITSGQTLQVRMTTSGSVSTTLTAAVTVGSSSTNWTTTTRSGSLKIFETASPYNGGFGSLSAADAVCQSEAGSAGYAGTYKAVFSSSTVSAASRLTLSYPIVNAYDGNTVAATNLWAGTITNVITTKTGGHSNSNGSYSRPCAWTNSNSNGTVYSSTASQVCQDWSSSLNSYSAAYGLSNYTDTSWMLIGTLTCDTVCSLYCVQQ